jgi:hypothetical protein
MTRSGGTSVVLTLYITRFVGEAGRGGTALNRLAGSHLEVGVLVQDLGLTAEGC